MSLITIISELNSDNCLDMLLTIRKLSKDEMNLILNLEIVSQNILLDLIKYLPREMNLYLPNIILHPKFLKGKSKLKYQLVIDKMNFLKIIDFSMIEALQFCEIYKEYLSDLKIESEKIDLIKLCLSSGLVITDTRRALVNKQKSDKILTDYLSRLINKMKDSDLEVYFSS